MDNLSLKFAEEAALRQVEECTDLVELKKLASSLIRGHFSAKALICHLMLQGLEDMTRDLRHSSNSAEKSSSGPWYSLSSLRAGGGTSDPDSATTE